MAAPPATNDLNADRADPALQPKPAPPATVLSRLQYAALLVAGLALVGVTAVQFWQVVARYVLNDSPGWTEPLALLLLTTAMSLGAGAAVRSRSHFGFFIAVEAAPPRVARALRLMADVIIGAVGATIAVYGTYLLVDGWNVPMAGAPLPHGLPFLPMSIGGTLMCVFSLERIFAREPRA